MFSESRVDQRHCGGLCGPLTRVTGDNPVTGWCSANGDGPESVLGRQGPRQRVVGTSRVTTWSRNRGRRGGTLRPRKPPGTPGRTWECG